MGPCRNLGCPSLTGCSLQRLGVQKCQQIFRTAREVGLLTATKPLCDRAYKTIMEPVLASETIQPLRLESVEAQQSLLYALGYSVEGSNYVNVDMVDPQDLQSIGSDIQGPARSASVIMSDKVSQYLVEEDFGSDFDPDNAGEGDEGDDGDDGDDDNDDDYEGDEGDSNEGGDEDELI